MAIGNSFNSPFRGAKARQNHCMELVVCIMPNSRCNHRANRNVCDPCGIYWSMGVGDESDSSDI